MANIEENYQYPIGEGFSYFELSEKDGAYNLRAWKQDPQGVNISQDMEIPIPKGLRTASIRIDEENGNKTIKVRTSSSKECPHCGEYSVIDEERDGKTVETCEQCGSVLKS